MDWNQEIKAAIEQRRVILHRQPIITPRMGGERFEILSRIEVGDKLIPPVCWLGALADDPVLAANFDLWVLEEVAARCARLNNIQAWVNLTGSTIKAGLPEQALKLIQAHQCSPRKICFEVTEQVAVDNPGTLLDLKMIGFDVAIDDCGCGNSNWAKLVELPLTWAKIDGQLMGSPRKMLAAKHLCLLAKELGLSVIAEWVVNQKQAEWMLRWGCDGFQGFNVPRYNLGYPSPW